ncbi:MAG: hypothetical protein OXH09_01885 [Gammaproteobacteria bacterium]|nr:hypothetical protein [Gammaproteobacteria bacterium]
MKAQIFLPIAALAAAACTGHARPLAACAALLLPVGAAAYPFQIEPVDVTDQVDEVLLEACGLHPDCGAIASFGRSFVLVRRGDHEEPTLEVFGQIVVEPGTRRVPVAIETPKCVASCSVILQIGDRYVLMIRDADGLAHMYPFDGEDDHKGDVSEVAYEGAPPGPCDGLPIGQQARMEQTVTACACWTVPADPSKPLGKNNRPKQLYSMTMNVKIFDCLENLIHNEDVKSQGEVPIGASCPCDSL